MLPPIRQAGWYLSEAPHPRLPLSSDPAGRARPRFLPQGPFSGLRKKSPSVPALAALEMLTFILCCPLLLSSNLVPWQVYLT